MKINILEKLVLEGKSAWAKVLAITPLVLLGIIYLIFGLISDSNPVMAEKGLLWGLLPLLSLPINYFFIFFKWFKV
jgi:hypothetical protein